MLVWVGLFGWLTACGADDDSVNDGSGSDTGMADGSSEGPQTTAGGVCETTFPAIVTDIDETLTISDEEFFQQIADGTYEPMLRAGGPELLSAYADLGYRILYLTARSESITLQVTGETAREATEAWLADNGYPAVDGDDVQLILSDSLVVNEAARQYKAGALMGLQDMGWRFDYAYGNATSDIQAYEDAMIDKEDTFIIGEEAGMLGTVAIEGEDWQMHLDSHIPTVDPACP